MDRLWSIARWILTEIRRRMTPQMFEAVVFLRLNKHFWDANLVEETIALARMETITKRAEAHFE